MRQDLEVIAGLINPGARVLDLGCGNGDLLAHLAKEKRVTGYGVENSAEKIQACLNQGVNVIEHDLDQGLGRFPDDSFDMVVMTETLQATKNPVLLLSELLRIGHECIITFPNFGHWQCRIQLISGGRMPVAEHLPYEWYDTPNIHLCTVKDFDQICLDKHIKVIERFVVDQNYKTRNLINQFSNLFGVTAFYRLGRVA